MKTVFVILLGNILFSSVAFSMGGDKPGPNGGYITMPGTYHVELVDKGTEMRVYLLDISMKNPTTENSTVSLRFINNEKNAINCIPKNKFFICDKPHKDLGKYKSIQIESVRNKVKGKVASYQLPLKFE